MLLPAVFFMLFIVLIFSWLIAEKRTKYKEMINQYKEEYVFSMFFSIAFAILGVFGINEENAVDRSIFRKSKEKRIKQFKILYGELEHKKHYWLYLANIISAIYITITISVFLLFAVSYQEAKNASAFQIEMERPVYGQTDSYDVAAEFKSKDEVVLKDVEIIVEGQLPTEQKAKEIIESEIEGLWEYVKNENSDFSSVNSDLRFPTRNETKGIDIKWNTNNPSIIGRTGKVVNEGLDAPIDVKITAILSIDDVYSEEIATNVTVISKQKEAAKENELIEPLTEKVEMIIPEINENINKDLASPTVEIPREWNSNISINWNTKDESKLPFVFLITIAFGGFIVYYINLKTEEGISERKDKIKMDFPEMLNKLVLLLGAGSTASTAMDKIVNDYRASKDKKVLYEELIILNDSIYGDKKMSYGDAYETFAKRCMVQEAIRFAALMIQHERTGSSNLVNMLRLYSTEAWQERKRIAERKGKMAENKLLAPILLIFAAIIIIVMMPITTMMKI